MAGEDIEAVVEMGAVQDTAAALYIGVLGDVKVVGPAEGMSTLRNKRIVGLYS